MKKLDHAKPKVEVFGDTTGIPYRYIQDGVYFDGQGNEVSLADVAEAADAAAIASQSQEARDKMQAARDAKLIEKAKAEAKLEAEAEMDAKIAAAVADAIAKPGKPGKTLKKPAGKKGSTLDEIAGE